MIAEKDDNQEIIMSPLDGEIVKLPNVPDEAFAEGLLGQGIAILPSEEIVYAPANGTVQSVFESKHAITLVTDGGAEILLHVGINTVEMEGTPFNVQVSSGERVSIGDVLMTFDRGAITAAGYLLVTPIIVCNSDEYQLVEGLVEGEVTNGTPILRLVKGGK